MDKIMPWIIIVANMSLTFLLLLCVGFLIYVLWK